MTAAAGKNAATNEQMMRLHLQKIPLLAGVSPETLCVIGSALQLRTVERGTQVLQKGSPGDHLLFVLSGRLQAVDITEDGREIGLNLLVSGDYFGELSIVDGLPRSASVVALENSLIALLPRTQALALIYHTPLIVERLLKRMASSVRKAADYRTILGIPNASQRVFALLQKFAQIAPGGLVVIDKLPTQQEMAIMVNTSRETVSRAIHILLTQGVVEKDLRRLIVRQPEVLRQAVSGEALSLTR